jgi:hemolysin III
MTPQEDSRRYTMGEEIANSVTHGVGVVLAIVGLGVLIAFAAHRGTAWHMVSCSIYGATLILLFTASTVYHALPYRRAKTVFRALDHSAIYLLIAGTYTPFMLVNLRGPWGWSLFGAIWGLAILGIILKVTIRRPWRAASVTLYLFMGWVIVIAAKPLVAGVPTGGLVLLGLGGLAYTGGVVFYVWRRMPYHHAVWHLFVLAGSIFHFFAVLLYVIPVARPA